MQQDRSGLEQYHESRGKLDDCVVSDHLGRVADDLHVLLNGEFFPPQETSCGNRVHGPEADDLDEVVYRLMWRIALEQVQGALANGVRFW